MFNSISRKFRKLNKLLRLEFLSDIERYVAYRTYDKYNSINISTLNPSYYDKDTIMLHGMFELLVDFIEVELANRQYWHELYENKNKSILDKLKYKFSTSMPKNKSREYGLKYVDFYRNYTEETTEHIPQTYIDSQREFGNELYELYIWWKDTYPNRKDSMDLSGWSAFCDKNRERIFKFKKCIDNPGFYETYDELTEKEEEEKRRILELNWKIDQDYLDEEQQMLIRLIKIRKSLWT